MGTKNYLNYLIAGTLMLSTFGACTKKINTLEKQPLTSTMADDTARVGMHVAAVSNFTYTVKPNEWMVDGTNIPAGGVVYIPAGRRGALLLKNFKGTLTAPIIVVNQGGKVTFSTDVTASYGFKTQNCRYFKVLGNGDPAVKYGFEVEGGNIGMTMDDLSTDFEIGYFDVHNSGFAGIMAKTDPTCDPATWRGHFTMRNVNIHDNYIHQTGGEGIYIGNSFYEDGVSSSCGTVLPHDVVNLRVLRNVTDSTGSEGIQVGSATSGCIIYGNNVNHPGISPFSAYQDNGIQIGEGTGGKCYNNVVKNAPGNGIIVLGLGDNLVYNNYILNSKSYGIFADSRYTPGPNFQFINNTVVGSLLGGIKLNSETIPMNTVINNAFIQPAGVQAIIKKSSDVKLTALNNYVGTNVNDCKFLNYNGGNFRLQASSPFIDKGTDVAVYGVQIDYYGKDRDNGEGVDVGATEY
ncbi:right-handed parallel beta-helix repeat-containing protein [Mucilaginibacter celer]|uniref:Right-handed parallel beta-helix repeat-containing protein n=1 Tax=Mucilaginibacter celer TaxID=2305508 RepID=A0A494VTG6_9SPHI|nr:right-handed parallel beta-helix repeat-containing protein [Mucilaginibacter celer]AYL96710.1 right-handed parallel beta-helix repeat-containing protein [Mucilaginibacter celer]